MGVAYQSMKWMHWLQRAGARFPRVLTLGRLNYYAEPEDPGYLANAFSFDESLVRKWLKPRPKYSEPFFRMLGASEVDSIDNSAYEGATIVHDLNEPAPPELHNRFDLVYDGGTLEHVFNFPEALRSAMRMVKVGGSFVCQQCFNNMAGHGFYCFGPEVFFRAFSPENGFVLKNIRIYERYPRSPWYRLSDPMNAERRIRLISWGLEVEVLVHAVKIGELPVFQRWPQQSDYANAWSEGTPGTISTRPQKEELGVRSGSAAGGLKVAVLKAIRKRALHSPGIGRLGKYWLNAQNYSLRSQESGVALDDPLLGGAGPML